MKKVTNNEQTQSSPSGAVGMHYGADPLIFRKAEELRNKMTPSEELLWNYLRSNGWGYKFRRQHPLFIYVADFYCHQLKLIIEIDGSVHQLEDVKRNDKIRQQHLENLGIKVIRFTNHNIMHNLETVVTQIQQTLQHESISK